MTDKQLQVFFEVHRDLPREGPGSLSSTTRAFASVAGLPPRPQILDAGCGPGSQTIALAQLSRGTVFAIDNHPPFIERVTQRAVEAGLGDSVVPMVADMTEMPFSPDTFDLIWAEGSISIVGVAAGLTAWRPLLKSKGYAAFTEVSWLRADRPSELERFWQDAYPAITSVEGNARIIEAAGFTLEDQFVLPESDWWTDYYDPIEKKLPGLKEKYENDEEALEVLSLEEKEIELYRRCSSYYGYVFSTAKRTEE